MKNIYFVEHLLMIASDNILGEKQYVNFGQILVLSGKPVYAPAYSLFGMSSNENYFKQFFTNSLKLIVKWITKEGKLYIKYLD